MICFISDLHLCAQQPRSAQAFLRFLAGAARTYEHVWILGDLFEYWAGDDDLQEPFNRSIADALSDLTDHGVKVSLIVGNRDFLLGRLFSAYTSIEIVQEPYLLALNADQSALLLHGDTLCTDDIKYQSFRKKVRNPLIQKLFLSLPRFVRHAIAGGLRNNSEQSKQEKTAAIMDVNAHAVARIFEQYASKTPPVLTLIHGHTHRPACHSTTTEGGVRTRWVLPDWDDRARWLQWNGQGFNTREEVLDEK